MGGGKVWKFFDGEYIQKGACQAVVCHSYRELFEKSPFLDF